MGNESMDQACLPIAKSDTLLNGMGVLVVTKALDSDDMLAVDGAERGQACIDVQMAVD
jgi:hypothetical protein